MDFRRVLFRSTLPGRGSGFERLRLAQLLTQLKSSMEVCAIRGDAGCKGLKTRRIKLQEFCERLAKLATKSDRCSREGSRRLVFWRANCSTDFGCASKT